MESEENNREKTVRENKVAYASQLLSVLIQVVVYCLLLAKLGDILHVATQKRLRYLFVWESSWWIDVVMALYVVCVIAAIVHIMRRNCHIGRGYWLFGGFVTSVWAYIRFFPAKIPTMDTDDVYCFTNLEWLPSLTWADVFVGGLWLMFVAYLVGRLIYRKPQASETKRDVIKDNPIENKDEDKLDYARWAEIMCQEICDMENDKAYSYGVVGEWGIGKTSYINLLKRELEKSEQPIEIIDFNPRNSSRASRIQEDFLMTLCRSLKKYDLGLSLLTSRYVKALRLDSRIDIIASLLNIFPSGNVWRLRERISESIRRIGHKVVVFIDDLDRMGREEIIEVFKLIDCNASFPNTVFVTAYNKTQVNKVLASYQGGAINDEGVSYSDKYFKCEMKLIIPPNRISVLFRDMVEEDFFLKSLIPMEVMLKMFDEIDKYFGDVRELKKFVNFLAKIDEERWSEVNKVSFIKVQIIRFKYNEDYQKLMNRSCLDESQNFNTIKTYMFINSKKYKLTMQVVDILHDLFSNNNDMNYNSIVMNCSFDTYFVEVPKPLFQWKNIEKIFDIQTPFYKAEEQILLRCKIEEERIRTYIVCNFNRVAISVPIYQRIVQLTFCCYNTFSNNDDLAKLYDMLLKEEIITNTNMMQRKYAYEALRDYSGSIKSKVDEYIKNNDLTKAYNLLCTTLLESK